MDNNSKMATKGIFLVSLNSKRLTDFLKNNETVTKINDFENFDVFVFDIHETLNGLFFNTLNIQQQSKIIETTILQVKKQMIDDNTKNRQLIRFSEIQKEIKPFMSAVYLEYCNNESFKRHCKSQIFQNLQPKLREVGILDHKSSLIELLSPFLLSEIAFYLYLFCQEKYNVAFGLESEMEIIKSIKNGKYNNFNTFLINKIAHNKVEF